MEIDLIKAEMNATNVPSLMKLMDLDARHLNLDELKKSPCHISLLKDPFQHLLQLSEQHQRICKLDFSMTLKHENVIFLR